MSGSWHQACHPDEDITFLLKTVFPFLLPTEVLNFEPFNIATVGVALLATV